MLVRGENDSWCAVKPAVSFLISDYRVIAISINVRRAAFAAITVTRRFGAREPRSLAQFYDTLRATNRIVFNTSQCPLTVCAETLQERGILP